MRVLILGATGMIGTGALIECLEHPEVETVTTVGRRRVDREHPKLTQIEHGDFLDFGPITDRLADHDACLWCLGVSSAGMSEADYRRVTVDFTMAAAEVLVEACPGMTFCFVSGAGTDRAGRAMWARVKAEAEDRLQEMGFEAVYCFRPAFIQPMKGARSGVALYRAFYAVLGPLYPLLRRMRSTVTSTPEVGRALLEAALRGAPSTTLENAAINDLAAAARERDGGGPSAD